MCLKLAFVAALVAIIARAGIISASALGRISSHPIAAIGATFAIFGTIHVSVFRWQLLLSAQGQDIPFWRLWKITFASYFVGSTTLGTFGVDGLRLYYIGREKPASVGQAYLSIVVDRLLGLVGLLTLGFLLLAINYREIWLHSQVLDMVMASAAISGIIVLMVLFTVGFRTFVAPLLQKVRPFKRVTTHIDLLVVSYRNNLLALAQGALLSVVIQGLTLASLLILVRALFETQMATSQLGLAAVMTTLANQIPITPGGLGVGEGTFTYLCRLLDSSLVSVDYGSAVFLQRLIALLATVPGLFCYLAIRKSLAAHDRTA